MADVLGGFVEVEVLPASVPERLHGQQVAQLLQTVWVDGGFQSQAWQLQ